MRIRCNRCAEIVSTEVPSETIVRAFVLCPECVEKEALSPLDEIPGNSVDLSRSRQDLFREVKT